MKKRFLVGMMVAMLSVSSVFGAGASTSFAKDKVEYTEMTQKELKKELKSIKSDISYNEYQTKEVKEKLDKLESKKKKPTKKIKEVKAELKELQDEKAELKEAKKEVQVAYKQVKERDAYNGTMENKGAYVVFSYEETTFGVRQVLYDVKHYYEFHPETTQMDFWGVGESTSGEDTKFISFTVPSDMAELLKDENNVYGAEFTMREHMDDLQNLWILPSMQ